MNQLIKQQKTMSSREIAEITGKEHKNILRDIENMLNELKIELVEFLSEYVDAKGERRKSFNLPKRETLILVSGYNIAMRAKIIDRWQELEAQRSLKAPQNLLEALQLAVKLEEEKEALRIESKKKDQLIGEYKPKADYVDTILKSTSLVTITQIAKDYGKSGRAMNQLLNDLEIQYFQSGQWWLYSKYHAQGYTHSETISIKHNSGIDEIRMITKWTQKGRLFLYDKLKTISVLPLIEQKAA
ncbi:phage regulatory protein/antirepressor Ant [Caedibacter taeniospiralis]|uniref:phage regulatory protein/antirepressor Ant n=1 Tax=Caedibacter taeniospiralis TaxID=28907 RepID=UPI000C27ED95|nr:phage regulatory protein/antirepressor Ant [Caedibacter taeniospiralis]